MFVASDQVMEMSATWCLYAAGLSVRKPDGTLWGRREDAVCISGHMKRARRRDALSEFTTHDWRMLLDYFGGRCGYCHNPHPALQAEHIAPLSRGGDHTTENIAPACPTCNHRKATDNIIGFLISGRAANAQ